MKRNRNQSGNKVFFGLMIIVAGLVILARQVGLLPALNLEENWPLLLMAFALFLGIKNRFSTPAPYILFAIGLFNYIPAFTFTVGNRQVDSEDLVFPVLLIGAGLIVVLRARQKSRWMETPTDTDIVSENTLNADVIFGGRKEIVTSKDFKGGRVRATFGGAEINLLQADTSAQSLVLHVRATCGGCELIIPAHWDLKNEVETILGSVEDKRSIRSSEPPEKRKTLVLRGSCVCGGIEIKSF